MSENPSPPSIPSKPQLLEYIESQPHPVTRREIARAFNIKGSERIIMKAQLKQLMTEGKIVHHGGRHHKADFAPVSVLEVLGHDNNNRLVARPLQWSGEGSPPQIQLQGMMKPRPKKLPRLNRGDRVLTKIERRSHDSYIGWVIQILAQPKTQLLVGQYSKTSKGGLIEPSSLGFNSSILVNHDSLAMAKTGDIVVAAVEQKHGNRHGIATITKNLGSLDLSSTISFIAIHEHNLPHEFEQAAIEQAAQAELPPLGEREDLRSIPLVTIDGADARDFDDAVWAEPDQNPNNPGGWHAIVAIADVSFYVLPDSPLDKEAQKRGNSVYFPNQVIPMLPEALSCEMCSLKPDVDRACLAVHLWFDKNGNMLKHKFTRGLMRSAARLTYEQTQQAHEANDKELKPLLEPLYGVYGALSKQRTRRHALNFIRQETQLSINETGDVQEITSRPSLHSHKLIEELMIAANVAAATFLEQNKSPCMFRVHDEPDPLKLKDTIEFLRRSGTNISKKFPQSAQGLQQILDKVAQTRFVHTATDLLLRTMARAQYQPKNLGHFGLQLTRYCHFTSPIRRYADLLVHRAIISVLDKEAATVSAETWPELGEHLCVTERRADKASRTTTDRFIARYMRQNDKIGDSFTARVTSVTRFGLFITEQETGADGLIHIATLPNDYYVYEPRHHRLIGRRTRKIFTLGDQLKVCLEVADELTGKLSFGLINS